MEKDTSSALKEIIAETGATSGKDMGKVMGVASKKLAGLAEGRAISAKVKELLGEHVRIVEYKVSRFYLISGKSIPLILR